MLNYKHFIMLEERKDNLQNADGTQINSQESIINSINEDNAEQSEDGMVNGVASLESKDYDSMDMPLLVEEMKQLIDSRHVSEIKEHIEAIRKSFLNQYNEMIDEKKKIFVQENPDASILDFSYEFPLKNKLDQIYNLYKDKKNKHYQSIQVNLKNNLKEKQAIIEELKELIDTATDYQAALKPFNQLRDRWKACGAIPRDQYNLVWNNYHFHVERFYDQLHLDREARDKDFQNNYEQKLKLIERAKELLEQDDIHKAFKELQILHRIWKEEIGPVSREHREEIWKEFSDITKKLHDKREAMYHEIKAKEEQNYHEKKALIQRIQEINKEKATTHTEWQEKIGKVENLRDQFLKVGRVAADKHELLWNELKEELRTFNHAKNAYYKDIKKEQQENMKIRLEMIQKVNELKDSEDFENVAPILKKLQEDWKNVGHVPRKHADDLWKQFKESCNHFFDRFHEYRKNHISEEMENFHKKKAYLEELKSFTLVGDHQKDLEEIKKHIENWKAIGPVPQFRRHIEGKFNKILDALFDKLSLSKKESELVKFNNRLSNLVEMQDNRRIQQEMNFVQKKIDEVQSDILQLQNNVMFIQNANSDNPLVKEINKNIDRHKDELTLWKDKLDIIKNLLNQ